MTQDKYDSCTGFPILHCTNSLAIKPTTQLSCALAIFNDAINKIATLCDSTLTIDNNYLQQKFTPLQDNTYFVTGPNDTTPRTLSCDT